MGFVYRARARAELGVRVNVFYKKNAHTPDTSSSTTTERTDCTHTSLSQYTRPTRFGDRPTRHTRHETGSLTSDLTAMSEVRLAAKLVEANQFVPNALQTMVSPGYLITIFRARVATR